MAPPVALAPGAAHDILRPRLGPLGAFFRPRTVAVVGASERPGSVGRTVLWNLLMLGEWFELYGGRARWNGTPP